MEFGEIVLYQIMRALHLKVLNVNHMASTEYGT